MCKHIKAGRFEAGNNHGGRGVQGDFWGDEQDLKPNLYREGSPHIHQAETEAIGLQLDVDNPPRGADKVNLSRGTSGVR